MFDPAVFDFAAIRQAMEAHERGVSVMPSAAPETVAFKGTPQELRTLSEKKAGPAPTRTFQPTFQPNIWYHIETATERGIPVLLWCPHVIGCKVRPGFWSTYSGAWMISKSGMKGVMLGKPTHWMPFPSQGPDGQQITY